MNINDAEMSENERFIYDSIFYQVRTGFLSVEDIKLNIEEEIEDNEFEDELSFLWANEVIEGEYRKHLSESKTWERPTDTDRLIEAFDELCKCNIIALHGAGYTSSDGEYEAAKVEGLLREQGVSSDGYCFYHEQDLQRAVEVESPSLSLAFQKIDNEDEKVTLEVGKKVASVLKAHGFELDWDETAERKIRIPHFRWQWVYDETQLDESQIDENQRDLQDYDSVLALILNRDQPQ